MHVVSKWCRWRYTIHLRVFTVCHTYKTSQMSVQSQRASNPIRGTGGIDPWEHKGRGIQISLRQLKKHNEHGESVCELLKHIFSYRNLSRVWTSIQTIPNSKWLPSWRRCHVPLYLANLHPVLLLDPWIYWANPDRTRVFRIIHHWEPILTLIHIVRARRRLFHWLYIYIYHYNRILSWWSHHFQYTVL